MSQRSELPARDLDRRSPGLSPLLALVPAALPPAPSRAIGIRKADRLLVLEYELSRFLETSAPGTWREMRRVLWRLIRRARRELRAIERATAT